MAVRLEVDPRAATALGLAIDSAGLDGLPAWAREAHGAGRLAFLDLPLDHEAAESVRAWRDEAPPAEDVVLVGMGGSALSARIFEALRPAAAKGPRLHVLDTVDPAPVQHLMRTLDPAATCLLAVSKSGSTLETGAVFGVLEDWMQRGLGAAAGARIAIVSGEEENLFRSRAAARGYASFAIPAGVGGRYSALSPVGLLPAALVGVDPVALLGGAAAARTQCLADDVAANPALHLAGLHHAALEAGRGTSVLWTYGERLTPLGPWWAQLVGESLGKPGADGPVGPTPIAARGPADQHSLLQLLMEGPDDKLTVFVDAIESEAGPRVPEEAASYSAAAGHSLGTVLEAERDATIYAFAQAERPAVRVRLAGADADAVGAFLLTYEMAVVYWSRLLGVDPFGQPGVEAGKREALARLARPASQARPASGATP